MLILISVLALPPLLISAWFPFLIYFLIEEGVLQERIGDEDANESNNVSVCVKIWKSRVFRAILTATINFIFTWAPYFFVIVLYVNCGDRKLEFCDTVGITGAIALSTLTLFSNLVYPISFIWWRWF